MSRYYLKDGFELPSVTTITGLLDKPALVGWAVKMVVLYVLERISGMKSIGVKKLIGILEDAKGNYRKVSQKALDIGSAVHNAIEHYLKTGEEPKDPHDQVLAAFLAFLMWKDKYLVEVISTEETVYGTKYAGTQDLKAIIDPEGRAGEPGREAYYKKYVIDFKSSSGIYPEMRYQVAGYRQTDKEIEGNGVLRLDKETGLPEWKDISDSYEIDVAIFNHLTEIWWLTHPRKLKQFEEKLAA